MLAQAGLTPVSVMLWVGGSQGSERFHQGVQSLELRSGSSGQEYELVEEVRFRPSVHRGLELLD
jgi:hypothetical protein